MLLVTAFIWAIENVAQKVSPVQIGPFTMLACRGVLGLLAISPWLIKEWYGVGPLPFRARMRLLAGAVALSVPLLLQLIAAHHRSVSNLGFLLNTTIIFTPFLASLSQKRRPELRPCVVALTALAGVLLLSGGPNNLQAGDELRLLAAFATSVWFMLVGQIARAIDRPFLTPACQFAVVGAFGLIGSVGETPIVAINLTCLSPEIVTLGGLATILAFMLKAVTRKATSVGDAALVMSLVGLFGSTAASVAKGDVMTPANGLGAGIIVAAVVMSEVGGRLQPVQIIRQLQGVHHRVTAIVSFALISRLGELRQNILFDQGCVLPCSGGEHAI